MPTSVRRSVFLTDEENEYLCDILDMWIGGYADAHERQLSDDAVDDWETLLQLSGGLIEQQELAQTIRERLEYARSGKQPPTN